MEDRKYFVQDAEIEVHPSQGKVSLRKLKSSNRKRRNSGCYYEDDEEDCCESRYTLYEIMAKGEKYDIPKGDNSVVQLAYINQALDRYQVGDVVGMNHYATVNNFGDHYIAEPDSIICKVTLKDG